MMMTVLGLDLVAGPGGSSRLGPGLQVKLIFPVLPRWCFGCGKFGRLMTVGGFGIGAARAAGRGVAQERRAES